MKFDTVLSEAELEPFRDTWSKFKLTLLKNHSANLASTIQSLFLLELECHLPKDDLANDGLGLSDHELNNVDRFLVRYEHLCIPRILLKFDKFKSWQGELNCSSLRHQTHAKDKDVNMCTMVQTDAKDKDVNMCTMVQTDAKDKDVNMCIMVHTENSSANCTSLKDSNGFMPEQKLMPILGMFEKNDDSEAGPDFVLSSKMSQTEKVVLDSCLEVTQESSVIQSLNTSNSKIKNDSSNTSAGCNKSHMNPEASIGSSRKSEKLPSQKVTKQALDRRSRRSDKHLLCPICGFEYQNTRLLKKHIESHSDRNKQKCTSCFAVFNQKNKLEPSFQVCLCGQSSSSSNSKKQSDNSCIISDSVTKLWTESQFLSDKKRFRHTISECTLQLNCPRSSSSCLVKSYSKSHRKNKTKHKQFKCDICHCQFYGLTKLKRHKLSHTGEKPYNCSVCETSFADKSHLNVHARLHSGEKPFKCSMCESSFSESTKLRNHNRVHTGEKPYVCEICGSSFSVSSSLKSHTMIHSGERPFKCDVCDFASAHSSNLKTHSVVHTGERKFRCDKCGASFTETAKLKRHTMVHTGEKPYNCEVCGTRFADKSHLTVHMRIHSGEKPFKCSFCDSAFVESSKLKNHVRTHTGEKPYVCEICGMSFAVSYSLKSHMRRHTGEKPYKCDICGYLTSQSSNLKTHMIVHTGARSHVCDMCGVSFSELSKLNRHKVIHLDHKEGSIENTEQNSDEVDSLNPELFYIFSTGSDGIITL